MTLPAHLGYVALVLLVGGESLGLLVPAETALLAAGVLARQGDLQIEVLLPLATLAAIAGDNVAYLLGRSGGKMLLLARGPWRGLRMRTLERGRQFFARHGARAVFLARWVAFARVTAPWLAGTSGMPWRTFLRWNALGGVAWVTTVALAGYAFGTAAGEVFATTSTVLLVLLAVLGLAVARRARRADR